MCRTMLGDARDMSVANCRVSPTLQNRSPTQYTREREVNQRTGRGPAE